MAPDSSKPEPKSFTFELSLSVLNHLGRNLYRSFITVLGEAVSNAWDAEAKNVWIEIDKDGGSFVIKDDGDGMTAVDFQEKFLKIGYSKRKGSGERSKGGRPFIGRKGIGKLALLSCADSIAVMSCVKGGSWVGGVIENAGLDKAILEDLKPSEYRLLPLPADLLGKYSTGHEQGTIIRFSGVKGGIRHTAEHLKKIVALYFRFSLLDEHFNIFIDGEKVTHSDLKSLAESTEFLWTLGERKDPYVDDGLSAVKERRALSGMAGTTGFIASVIKPRDLSIVGTGERVGVDLFVNGRLRERDVLRHIPTARVAESYLYGQLHVDGMDSHDTDRFTSSREGVVAGDPQFQQFLKDLRAAVEQVIKDWDAWRRRHREDGDPEDKSISPKERKSLELFNVVVKDYAPPPQAENKEVVDRWIGELLEDAKYNFISYADCFVSENLVRNLIVEHKVALSKEAQRDIAHYRKKEDDGKKKGNISIELRRTKSDLSYLDMDGLAYLVEKSPGAPGPVSQDADEYKPMQDAVMHTALLSEPAKKRLSAVFDNISARVRKLLYDGPTGGGRASK
ncbi:MAG: ATP-binding protein [Planctomycetes bacterium]|nr:ATP-binding protein [Planctomycetota bacterium]